jgi:hypothetical protein
LPTLALKRESLYWVAVLPKIKNIRRCANPLQITAQSNGLQAAAKAKQEWREERLFQNEDSVVAAQSGL